MSAPDRRWPPAWAASLAGPDTDETALYLALEAGTWPGELPGRERRALALLVLASCDARQEGATRLSLGGELAARLASLGVSTEDRAEAAALAAVLPDHPALAPLVGRPGDHRPFIVDGPFLYQERDLRLEERLAEALAARLAAPPFTIADPAGALAAAAMKDRRWTAAQTAAIEAALARRLTVVSGGPGSGKTALIGGIVRAWRASGMGAEAIAIAAPTGKAANRIAEGLSGEGPDTPVPGTLHRLLGFSGRPSLRGGAFRHHENHPLPQAAVIVDEASMVDLELLEQLARALRPDARLVLIGDADQLPAIQVGSVFRDLGAIALRLPESHRMSPDDPAGAEILGAARRITAGQAPAVRRAATGAAGLESLELAGFELVEPSEADASGRRLLAAFLERWVALHLRPVGEIDRPRTFRAAGGTLDPAGTAFAAAWLDRHRRARLLTVTRVGFAGADRINELLARRAREDLASAQGPIEIPPGTPVMMIENDYDRGLMNGDQGIVLWLEGDGPGRAPAAFVAFPRGAAPALYPFATLRGALAVSYATTVHKAQGSELDQAALILPESDLPLLSRELIYTAVTRARRSMVVVGRRALLEQAIGRPLGRASGLAERLARRGAFGAERP